MPEQPVARRVFPPNPRTIERARRSAPPLFPPGGGSYQDPPIAPERGAGPTTVFVGGSSRGVVNAVAYALAELIDLTPFWLNVKDSRTRSIDPDPGSVGWIPPDRMFVSEDGRGLEVMVEGAMQALSTVVRSDEPASALSNLTEFLKLPELIQDILSAAPENGAPKALVAANSDRVTHLFPQTAKGLRQFFATIAAANVSILAAHTGPVGPGRFGFATVFQVRTASPGDWIEGTLICEKGIEGGPFAVGRTTRLSDVPGIARVLNAIFPAAP